MRIRFVHLIVSALVVAAIALAQGDAEQVLRGLGDRWQELYNQRDYQGLVDMYTDDAIFYDLDGSIDEGREGILAGLAQPLPVPPGEGTVEVMPDEVEISGDMAYGVGSYTVTAPDGSIMARGTYMTINKLVDGEWKIHRHIANLQLPEPEAAAP
jgi:uncharacterized protein (TIGR02246 family)